MVVVVASRAYAGRWTWQAKGMMCDGIVTPEVGAGHAHAVV
jgi:hypothetical protein